MNDTELGTALRDSVADIHAATPVEAILRHGRSLRARRRVPLAAGGLAVVAGAAVAVTTAVTMLAPAAQPAPAPSSHHGLASSGVASARPPARVELAAWTVARQPNGDIDITINQLKDPAGLQATLRADGLPVTVSFAGPIVGPACQGYAASLSTLRGVAQFHRDGITIDPSALPSGVGLAIFDEPGTGLPPHVSPAVATHGYPPLHPLLGSLLRGLDGPLAVGLVDASPQCTG